MLIFQGQRGLLCEELLVPLHVLFGEAAKDLSGASQVLFVGFGLKFQGVERPFHSLGQVNGVSLKPPLGASDPVLCAPPKPTVRGGMGSNGLGMSARCPQNPVGMQAVLL